VIAQRYKGNEEFIETVISLIKTVLDAPDEFVEDEQYQKLRKEYLEFFNKFPWFESIGKHYKEFFKM